MSQPKSEQAGRDGVRTRKQKNMNKTKVRAWESVVAKDLRSKSTLGVFCSWGSFHPKGVFCSRGVFCSSPPEVGVFRSRARGRTFPDTF